MIELREGMAVVSKWDVEELRTDDSLERRRRPAIMKIEKLTPQRVYLAGGRKDFWSRAQFTAGFSAEPADVAVVQAWLDRAKAEKDRNHAEWQARRRTIEADPRWQMAKVIYDAFAYCDIDSLARSHWPTELLQKVAAAIEARSDGA